MSAAYLYFEPRQRPLSSLTLTVVPLGTYTFYYTGTTTLAPIYASNSTGGAQLSNPLTADSAGLFPAIYLDPSITYRTLLKNQAGVTLEDTDPSAQYQALLNQSQITIASANTTDLGTTGSNNVLITGTTTITSFGSSALLTQPIYYVKFATSLTITYNATSLLTPGNANIVTQSNDFAILEYLGSGNWQVVSYTPASGILSLSQLTVGPTTSGAAITAIGATSTSASISVKAVVGAPAGTVSIGGSTIGVGDLLLNINGSGIARIKNNSTGAISLETSSGGALRISGTQSSAYEPNFGTAALANIATYETGTWVPTFGAGFSSPPSITVQYTRIGNRVTLTIPPGTGTSNNSNFSTSALPSALWPVSSTGTIRIPILGLVDNGSYISGSVIITTSGIMTFLTNVYSFSGSWTASGSKGFGPDDFYISYLIS